MNLKSILITGGAGFIGSNLCEYFLEKGYRVVCLDNFSTGHRYNIEPFIGHSNFTLIEGDIRHIETCEKAVQNIRFCFASSSFGIPFLDLLMIHLQLMK